MYNERDKQVKTIVDFPKLHTKLFIRNLKHFCLEERNMKSKFCTKLICLCMVFTMLFTNVMAAVEIYNADGKSKVISESELEKYKKEGWSDNISDIAIKMYEPDGSEQMVPKNMVEYYRKVFKWSDNLEDVKCTVYNNEGKSKKILKGELDTYKAQGWSDKWEDVVTTMYTNDGRCISVFKAEVDKYVAVGWYKNYSDVVTQMYAGDKVINVYNSQVQDYLNVGWSILPQVKVNVTSGLSTTGHSSTDRHTTSYYGSVSSLQQFKYKDKGIGYAYVDGNYIQVVKPTGKFKINKKHSRLGDVISDENGNIYIVWGDENEDTSNHNKNTVFISKYDSSGNHIKSVGFPGVSKMGEDGNTASPFNHGGCDSVIHDGVLMVNYARKMYNGHQSNNVIGVKTDDMKAVSFSSKWDIPYSSHSFNQKVTWSKKAGKFVYADLGDAYPRGFALTVGKKQHNVFHFYLQANANYNMHIVNRTFAQLGNIIETDKGIMLIGASAKTLGGAAEKEAQNLFVQVFDPTASSLSESAFVGGSKRSGETSTNIKDNSNSPLTPTTDYGVQWLTHYNSSDVVTPHAVKMGDKVLVIWRKLGTQNPYCEVLAADGSVVLPPVMLSKDVALNVFEDPIYVNGKVYWTAFKGGGVKIYELEVKGL